MLLGSHVGMSGKQMLLGSVLEADSYNANCFMVYTGAPQNTRRKALSDCMITEAHAKMQELGINPMNCIVHAPYIVNMGNPDPEKFEFAVSFIAEEVRRTYAFGFKQLVLHPGAALGGDRQMAINNIARGLSEVFERTKETDVQIALETMAGKGTEIGINFQELKDIIDRCDYPERISICFDTCHTNDSGYDLKENFDQVLHEFDSIIGLDKLGCMHINDSMNQRGARKDRHANIGFGTIGFDALNYIIHHPKLMTVPKFLESPYVTESVNSDDKVLPPYKHEIKMLEKGKFNEDLIEDIRNDK